MVGGLEVGGQIEDGVDGIAGAVGNVVLECVEDRIEAVEAAVDIVLAGEAEGAAIFAGYFADCFAGVTVKQFAADGGVEFRRIPSVSFNIFSELHHSAPATVLPGGGMGPNRSIGRKGAKLSGGARMGRFYHGGTEDTEDTENQAVGVGRSR